MLDILDRRSESYVPTFCEVLQQDDQGQIVDKHFAALIRVCPKDVPGTELHLTGQKRIALTDIHNTASGL
jgi:hypothetical protein